MPEAPACDAAGTPDAGTSVSPENSIAIVVLTHNRVHLLQKCVENVLLRTSEATREIVIWDNASPDATREYLRSLEDQRIRVVISEENIGQNAYARGFGLTTASYFIELDDDVVDAPLHWDAMLLEAFTRLPGIGFLAADLVDDPHDLASRYRHHVRPHEYIPIEENGVRLLRGPTGGGCAITSRELNERVGGFGAAVLADLKVHHTGGPHYTKTPKEKVEYWQRFRARQARRNAVKRALVRIPFVRRLNARFGWFVPPS